MKLPLGLTAPEIRILQEYRRLETTEMTSDQIAKILHPAVILGDATKLLIDKGLLSSSGDGSTLSLTDDAREFLARKSEPESAPTKDS